MIDGNNKIDLKNKLNIGECPLMHKKWHKYLLLINILKNMGQIFFTNT
jgi:hypothetical protein